MADVGSKLPPTLNYAARDERQRWIDGVAYAVALSIAVILTFLTLLILSVIVTM